MSAIPARGRPIIAYLLALLVLAGCGPMPSRPLPLATVSPRSTDASTADIATSPLPTSEPAAGLSISPLPTAGAERELLQLVVLHSNDNWGETEPCG